MVENHVTRHATPQNGATAFMWNGIERYLRHTFRTDGGKGSPRTDSAVIVKSGALFKYPPSFVKIAGGRRYVDRIFFWGAVFLSVWEGPCDNHGRVEHGFLRDERDFRGSCPLFPSGYSTGWPATGSNAAPRNTHSTLDSTIELNLTVTTDALAPPFGLPVVLIWDR